MFLFQILKVGMWQERDRDDADGRKRETVKHNDQGSGLWVQAAGAQIWAPLFVSSAALTLTSLRLSSISVKWE